MDPAVQTFLEKLETILAANIAEIQAQSAKIDDLVVWRPDLEWRAADLGDVVAELQLAQPPPTSSSEDGKASATPGP